MLKGSKMSVGSRKKVSAGLKEYFKSNSPWNKGLKYAKYDEPAYKRLRRNKEYYLKELKANAVRSHKKKYDEHRMEVIKENMERYHQETGRGRMPREWSEEEINYLRSNYEKPRLELCKYLGRSWSSVGHKICRLGLQKYNKWN